MKVYRFLLSFFITSLCGHYVSAQETKLSLEECYRLAKENYPSIRKLDLIEKSKVFNISNANQSWKPQLSFNGQATYQSQVVNYGDLVGSIPNITLPKFSKDQYKILGELDQQLYDGGLNRYKNDETKANAALQKQNIEVDLYKIKERINSIFFSVLLIDNQLKQNDLNKSTLVSQLKKTQGSFDNGTAYKSEINELKAEVENLEMTTTDQQADQKAYLRMLSIFIGKDVTESAGLEYPSIETNALSTEIKRPELEAFDLQKQVYQAQENQLKADYKPKFNAFFQGAYGRPTLNALKNNFGAWYITGVKMSWNLGSLYTLKNQRAILQINQQSTDVDRDVFLRNLQQDIVQQDEDIKKYQQLIVKDQKIIDLRSSVTESAVAQLQNGVITTHEYIQKLNTENEAKQTLNLHRIQLLQAQYNLKFKSGN